MKCIEVNVLKERVFLCLNALSNSYFDFSSSCAFSRIILEHALNQVLFTTSYY